MSKSSFNKNLRSNQKTHDFDLFKIKEQITFFLQKKEKNNKSN